MPTKLTTGLLMPPELRGRLFAATDLERLRSVGDIRLNEKEGKITDAEAIEILRDCDVAFSSWGTPIPNAAILAACPKLRVWEHIAGTVKHFFGPHLKGRDLTIASVKGAIADNVAEMTLGHLIWGARKILPCNTVVRSGGFKPQCPPIGVLSSSTIGIIGASEVGKRVINLLRPFRSRVLVFDPFLKPEAAEKLGVTLVSDLVELFRQSNLVTLHTPLLPATERLVRAEHFKALRDGGSFINTSQGMCVDEAAMIAELTTGRIWAYLDVSWPEPAAADSPLRLLPNVILTPHIAGPAGHNMGTLAVDDVIAFANGKQPAHVITEDQLSRIA